MATETKKKFEGVKAMTPIFRASYMQVFQPKAFNDTAKPKYSVEMLFHKTKTDLTEFRGKMQLAAVKAWGKDKAKWPKNFRWPFKDGEEEQDKGEHYKGHVFARAETGESYPPGIYDQQKNDIMDKRSFVSGDYACASVFLEPYENVGGKDGRSGIKIYLRGIQLVKKGEPFGAAGNRDDFSVVEGEDGASPDEGTSDEMEMGF